MPTYPYACTACGHTFEAQQSFTDPSLTQCPECSGRLRKVFSSVGVVFKGSGFYRTDSRAGAKSGSTVPAGSSGDGGSSSGGSKSEGSKSEGSKSGGSGSGGTTTSSSGGSSSGGSSSGGSSSNGSSSGGSSGGSSASPAAAKKA